MADRFQFVVSVRRRRLVEALVNATDEITWDEAWDAMKGYFKTHVRELEFDLQYEPAEQARFIEYVKARRQES